MKQLVLSTLIAATLFGCASTQVVKSWQEPQATFQPGPSNKILAIAMVKDETSRRVIEDQLVKRLGTNGGVASYTLLTPEMLKDTTGAALTKIIQQEKFNYLLLMRLADIEKETSYVHGTTTGFYGGYGRYYGYGAGMYTSPGYYTTDKNYFVETAVYSIEPDKLLWTGTTKTVNPTKLEKSINEIADVVTDKMKEDKFLK